MFSDERQPDELLSNELQPETMVDTITQVLRAISSSTSIHVPWLEELAIVQEVMQSTKDTIPANQGDNLWALRIVLTDCLSEMALQSPGDAKLLGLRFFDGYTVQDTAEQLGRSESNIFYRQRKAIKQLSELLITREQKTRATQNSKSTDRRKFIPPMSHGPLFGLHQKASELQKLISSAAHPWLVNIVGMGGMGKTTLAHSVATWAAESGPFEHILWITVKLEEFNTWSGERLSTHVTTIDQAAGLRSTVQHMIEPEMIRPEMIEPEMIEPERNGDGQGATADRIHADKASEIAILYDSLLDTIALQLGMTGLPHSTNAVLNPNIGSHSIDQTLAKQKAIRTFLEKHPALIIIDNLETLEDANLLVQHCCSLVQPSKMILTSRYSVQTTTVHQMNMDELSQEDSIGLLRAEAVQRGLTAVADEEPKSLNVLHELIGGNPLAIKLVAGQLTVLSLAEVIERVQDVDRSSSSAAYEMYHYLYRQTWSLLSPEAQDILLAMTTLPLEGCTLDQLVLVAETDKNQVAKALRELVVRSMVNVGGWTEKVYTTHRLTRTFLMTDILNWW